MYPAGRIPFGGISLYKEDHSQSRWFQKAFAMPRPAAAESIPLKRGRRVRLTASAVAGPLMQGKEKSMSLWARLVKGPRGPVHTTGTAGDYDLWQGCSQRAL